MADQTIRDLQAKLQEHRNQLQQVERLLQMNQSHTDDTLAKLRDDLVQVIKLTEELTQSKIAKTKLSAEEEVAAAEAAAAVGASEMFAPVLAHQEYFGTASRMLPTFH